MGKGKRALQRFFSTSSLRDRVVATKDAEKDPSILTPPLSSAAHSHSPLLNETDNDSPLVRDHLVPARNPPKIVRSHPEELEDVPLLTLITTYLGYIVLILFGRVRDSFGKYFKSSEYVPFSYIDGYAPMLSDFESFYRRRLYRRMCDCFNRPVSGIPGRFITLLDRTSVDYNRSFRYTGRTTTLLNFGSYNYLGFSQNEGTCIDSVEQSLTSYGVSMNCSRFEGGTHRLHTAAEELVARFVGKEAAMIVGTGFAANSATLPGLVSKNCLVISDEFNHSSIINGVRISGAVSCVFKHNNIDSLRKVLRQAISQGQPRTHRPWKKILVAVEGLYTNEGSILRLPEILELKRRYKFYLYIDEAHSIGTLGSCGKGICDYWGVPSSEVDILMGTFSKSFGAAGGYVAASREIIDHLRTQCYSSIYAEAISIPVLQQIISSVKIIMGEDSTNDGIKRLETLAFNARYFSSRLREMGFIVYGDIDSPIVPLVLFNPANIPAFSRECLTRGIAVNVISYPNAPIVGGRAKFCLSAAHTKEDLDWALQQISEIGDQLHLKLHTPNQPTEN
ncbi:PLP-dependent transferase [Basidiobolus meristosporus CBS 931.73]|uniref:serine C-palmitoyltransferase n=1 Tax=Basidiobolus meristosporus CBS 931.73 TaxID=1314790 RepID=A0A1Y1WZH0_9FUNG|nr:PLP-dependent transferase [Basidiobolus meristosporus CBS 931.73]|eukprot:ORX78951.1 PLP-dependent transferase [Basidiobolus meristosporus CBS 931.73]